MKTKARILLSGILATAIAVPFASRADASSPNRLIDQQCGTIVETMEICLSQAHVSGRSFIKISVEGRKDIFIPVLSHSKSLEVVREKKAAAYVNSYFGVRVLGGVEREFRLEIWEWPDGNEGRFFKDDIRIGTARMQ